MTHSIQGRNIDVENIVDQACQFRQSLTGMSIVRTEIELVHLSPCGLRRESLRSRIQFPERVTMFTLDAISSHPQRTSIGATIECRLGPISTRPQATPSHSRA